VYPLPSGRAAGSHVCANPEKYTGHDLAEIMGVPYRMIMQHLENMKQCELAKSVPVVTGVPRKPSYVWYLTPQFADFIKESEVFVYNYVT
jgi:hypothetical protein